ncbi:MAG: ribosome recycling factor [Elusimicrobia bacterium RIFOXYB2_FULL_48_7]|nr:MAG: ribosome recycling factor [Elusimicrobia bacterium RIFOXYB2_FULL_48_7]
MIDNVLSQAESLMKKTVEKFVQDAATLRTGRATPALIEGVKVNAYDSVMPINQVAGISIPDARTIEIRPWDHTVIPAIERGVFQAAIGLTPINDGKVIRLVIPPLTEERRKDLVKQLNKMAEEFRISVRNDRHKALEQVKKAEKEKKATEDQKFKAEEKLQKTTESFIKKIDEIFAAKQKEIMA